MVTKAMSEASSPLEQQQAEKLEQIGTYLQQVREEQTLSIEQIATMTMVQPRLLRAIESGQLSKLPEPVYIQGFLKRYSNALGLDGEAIAEAFPIKNDTTLYQKNWQELPAAQLRPLHLYGAYVALIVAAIAGLSYVLTRGPIRTATTVPASVSPSPLISSPDPDPSASSIPVNSPSTPAKPIEVDVTLKEQSWMRVMIDGKTEFEGMLNADTQRTWTAESELKIRAGNAGGVMVAYNNQPAKPLGARGTVEEVIFTPGSTSPLEQQ